MLDTVRRNSRHQAAELLEENLALHRELGDTVGVDDDLNALGDDESMPEGGTTTWRFAHEQLVATVRAQLDEATFAAAWSDGRAMSLVQAIAYALEVSLVDAEQPAQAAATSISSG